MAYGLFFSLVSLAAYGLVAHERTPGAVRAGLVYMILAVVGEAFLLLAFGSLDFIAGQVVGKAWATLAGGVAIFAMRGRMK